MIKTELEQTPAVCAHCGNEIEDINVIGIIKHEGQYYHGGCYLLVVH